MPDSRAHWDTVYSSKAETEVSWFEQEPGLSLELIAEAGVSPSATIIDVGAGASHLVDELIKRGGEDITVLDVSAVGLDVARARLSEDASRARWVVSDITSWIPDRLYDLWHDRAALHFLTEGADQAAYARVMKAALKPGGVAIIGTFAPDGPEKCSGLTVARHDSGTLQAVFGTDFELVASRRAEHSTPWGSVQRFNFATFRRR